LLLEIKMSELKCVIGKSFDRHGYFVRIYYDKDGKTFVAKSVDLEFVEREACEVHNPTMELPGKGVEFFFNNEIESDGKKLLEQKHKDKGSHIENLNQIIRSLIDK